MSEYSYDHITLAAEHDLGNALDRIDALIIDPESSPDQITAAETELAEAQAAHAGACAAASAARQAAEAGEREAGQLTGHGSHDYITTGYERAGAAAEAEQERQFADFRGGQGPDYEAMADRDAPDVDRLQTEFWARGIRRGARVRHRRARSGRESLTPAEIVAPFIEEGLSNPEIAARLLSRRTVATRVSHELRSVLTSDA